MRTNGKDRLIFIVLLISASLSLSAQWREIRFATNHIVSHVIAADDGRGMVFLSDTNVRVVTTRDYWRTFDTVLLPRPDFPYVFEPFSYDTTANGNVVVVGQHRPPLDTMPSMLGLLRYCNTSTAAYYSTDWGATWTEVLPRKKGRYMSISFRGRPEGMLLYELDWNDSLEHTDAMPMNKYSGRDLITVDQQLQVVSQRVLDTTRIDQRWPGKEKCIEGNPVKPGFIDRINDTILAMQTVLPCRNDLGIEDDPSRLYRNPYYIVDVSTNNGRTWETLLHRMNFNFNDHTANTTMKIVNDTAFIDNQGYIYEGTNIKPRKLICPALGFGVEQYDFWNVSDVYGDKLIFVYPTPEFFPSRDAGLKRDTVLVSFVRPIDCAAARQEMFEYVFTVEVGEKFVGYDYFKPQLLSDDRAVVGISSVRISTDGRASLSCRWSIFVLDSKATSTKVDASICIQERKGEIVFSKPLLNSGQAEYYSLIGSLVESVPIQAGSLQTRVPQLQSGVYFVRILNEAPLKFLVW